MSVISRYVERVVESELDPPVIEHFIACVLQGAHRRADALDKPDEARAILRMAHVFADELTMVNPRFDRREFIETAMDFRAA